MFTESAELYDALYFTWKDYAAEAADIAHRVRAAAPDARTVLDVACGTGEHARLLARDHGFAVDGIDLNPDFVRLAGAKNPSGAFTVADMMDFDLGRTYDAVICMFSSIGYVLTLPNLERALACFARHTSPDGVIVVEPWFPPEKMTDGHHGRLEADIGDQHVVRISTNRVNHAARTCSLLFEYTLEENGRKRHLTETHDLGLFTEAETLAAFGNVGLEAVHEAASASNRGLYVAHHPTRRVPPSQSLPWRDPPALAAFPGSDRSFDREGWSMADAGSAGREIVASIEAEYKRYKALGEMAFAQLEDAQLGRTLGEEDNSIATIVWHVSGNLASRFTDFLTSDGEKPWRDRESEFDARTVGHAEVTKKWEEGWRVLFGALGPLTDADLSRSVAIRGQPLTVNDALHRSLAHASYHVGQIVFLAKSFRGREWKSLSIPRGGTASYNQNPTKEKAPGR